MKFPKNCCQIKTKTGRRCWTPACCTITGKNMCILHKLHIYEKPALIIQNQFQTNRKRRAIEIFRNCPDDIQRKIIFHMREPDLIKKHHHDIIDKIVEERVNRVGDLRIKTLSTNFDVVYQTGLIREYWHESTKLLELIYKYYQILSSHTHFIFSRKILKGLYNIYSILLWDNVGQTYYYYQTNDELENKLHFSYKKLMKFIGEDNYLFYIYVDYIYE